MLKRAPDALVRELEKQKFARGVSARPRRGSSNPRYVPADVRRTVWQRDGGQCTFTSQSGKRCEECADLEFDHIEPLARGGRTVASNLRLRCRAHNQYGAECAFDLGFMRRKRDLARCRAEAAKARAKAEAEAKARSDAAARAAAEAAARTAAEAAAEVIPFLLHLGFNAKDARQGAAHAARLADAPLEQRVRVALQNLAPPCVRLPAPAAGGPA